MRVECWTATPSFPKPSLGTVTWCGSRRTRSARALSCRLPCDEVCFSEEGSSIAVCCLGPKVTWTHKWWCGVAEGCQALPREEFSRYLIIVKTLHSTPSPHYATSLLSSSSSSTRSRWNIDEFLLGSRAPPRGGAEADFVEP